MEKSNIFIDTDILKACLNYKIEDFLQAAMKESCMFPAINILTDEYIAMRQIYQYVFSQIVISKTGITRLDKRFSERKYLTSDKDKKGFYQKYDQLGLDYIFIHGNARVERLEPKEKKLIKEYLVNLSYNKELEAYTDALINMVNVTYPKVMAVYPDKPFQMFEPIRTVHGDYRISGDAIMFVLRSEPEFDENGNIRDMQKEINRENNFYSVASQLEKILPHTLEMPVKVVAELL